MSTPIPEDTITKLRGTEDWDYSQVLCRKCGSQATQVMTPIRTLLSEKGIYFQSVEPCPAHVQRGTRMVKCGSTDWKIEIVEQEPMEFPESSYPEFEAKNLMPIEGPEVA